MFPAMYCTLWREIQDVEQLNKKLLQAASFKLQVFGVTQEYSTLECSGLRLVA